MTATSPAIIDRRSLGLRRALSPTFPAGEMVFFIPWRVVAEESGAAHFGFGGAMLLDLLGPALRLLTDVADFHFSDIPVRGDDGARAIGANDDAAAAGASTGSTAPTPLIESRVDWVCGVLSLRHFRLARWCSLSLGGWWPKNPARRILASAARCCSTCSGRRWAAGGAVADFLLVIFRFGATMELGRSERTDDAAAVELRGRRRQHP